MRVGAVIACNCLAVLSSAGALAQAEPQVAPFETLALKIKVSPTSILPLEAVRLQITLSNPTNGPVAGHEFIAPAEGLLTLELAAPDEPVRRIHPGSEPVAALMPGKGDLPPGFEATHLTYLWWGLIDGGRRGAFFPSPGRYAIKAVLANLGADATIESNGVTVTVAAPGPTDSRAWKLLRGEGGADAALPFSLSDLWVDPSEAMLKEVLVWFPQSVYAVYARYALAMRYRQIAKYPAVARPLLEEVVTHEDFPFRDEVLYYLVEIRLQSAPIAVARRHLETLKADYPDTEWARAAEHLVARAEEG